MGIISKVLYYEIPDDVYSVKESSEFYIHQNIIDIEKYEKYQEKQIDVKNKILSKLVNDGASVNNCNILISSLHHKNILLCDLK